MGTSNDANDSAADPQAAPAKSHTIQVDAPGILPSEAWRLHTRLHNDTKEAELGYA
jgi:hypothetical protein